MIQTKQNKIIRTTFCVMLCLFLTSSLAGCSLLGLTPKQELKGIWVKADAGYMTVLSIEEELLRAFYIKDAQPITEENATALLTGNLAYFYSYKKTDDSLTLTELDKTGGELAYSMGLSEGALTLAVSDDRFVLNGKYTYVTSPIDGLSATNANDMLTQAFLNGTWIKNGAAGQGYYQYTILSINAASYSNALSINTTFDWTTGTFETELGFKGQVLDDWSTADTFFDFVVQDNRSIKVEYADGAEPDALLSEENYHVVITNEGILLSCASDRELAGYYYKSDIDALSMEGIWAEPFEDGQNREPRYFFYTIEEEKLSFSYTLFSYDDTIDHANLQSYYENSAFEFSYSYQKFDGGQIQFSSLCFWPIFVTDKLCLFGCSDGPNLLPKYWVPMYRLG